MQLNAMESVQGISKYLSFLSDMTLMLNEIGDLSINKYAETALIGMFDILYDTKFINTNIIQKNNPSIDLISEKKKIGIQITSNADLKKVKDCIGKFYKHEYYQKIDKLFVFSLTSKQRTYSQQGIDELTNQNNAKFNLKKRFHFDTKTQIIDKASLLLGLDLKDTEKLKKIENVLSKQFNEIHQRDDLSKYYEALKEKFCEVVMNDSMGMTLRDIYIEPAFKVFRENIKSRNAFIDDHDDFLLLKNKQSIHTYFNQYFLNQQSIPHINNSNFVLLLGYPGQGKTSFCKKLVYDYLLNKTPEDRELFYVKLKDIPNSKNLIHSPISVLLDEIRALTNINISNSIFRNSILVLDGLDELFMKDGLKLDDIEILCKELIREVQSESNKQMQIVVTSRKGYVDLDKLYYNDLLLFQLDSLDKAKQMRWVEKYSAYHPETWLTTNKLNEYHSSKSYLLELLEQPLLIHMVASLENEVSGEIKKAQVYDQLFTELIERKYSTDGQIQILKGITAKDLRKLVREIAFNIYKTGNGFVTRKVLLADKHIQNFLKKLPTGDFKDSLKGIMVAFYFQEKTAILKTQLEDEKEYVIEFLHKSLEEYMVAEKLMEDILNDFLSKSRDDEYFLNDAFTALQKLNDLFTKPITREIHEYLVQMIDDMSKEAKEELAHRMYHFFEDFVKHDFIATYDGRHQTDPMLLIFSTFNSIWLILNTLQNEKNWVTEKTKQKVINYLTHFNNVHPSIAYASVSHQNFSETTSVGARYLSNFSYANFDESEIENMSVVDEIIYNLSMRRTELNNVGWYDVTIANSSFIDSAMSGSIFHNVVFINVDFSNSLITDFQFKNVTFKKMTKRHFLNVQLWIDDLIILLENNVKLDLTKIRVHRNKVNRYYTYEELAMELKSRFPKYFKLTA